MEDKDRDQNRGEKEKKSRKELGCETVDLAHERIEKRWDVGKIHEPRAVQYN
jgi:hypothetical protein